MGDKALQESKVSFGQDQGAGHHCSDVWRDKRHHLLCACSLQLPGRTRAIWIPAIQVRLVISLKQRARDYRNELHNSFIILLLPAAFQLLN